MFGRLDISIHSLSLNFTDVASQVPMILDLMSSGSSLSSEQAVNDTMRVARSNISENTFFIAFDEGDFILVLQNYNQ